MIKSLLPLIRGAYRASRARIALGSTRARLKFPRLGSARLVSSPSSARDENLGLELV